MKFKPNTAWRSYAIVCTVLVFAARPAHAYLDPGTGSYATQIVLAGLMGALFSAKLIFRGITQFFRQHFSPVKPATTAAVSDETVSGGSSRVE